MTIDEAIKKVTSIKYVCRGLFPPDEQDALSLSIEALKVLSKRPFDYDDDHPFRLPGETEE